MAAKRLPANTKGQAKQILGTEGNVGSSGRNPGDAAFQVANATIAEDCIFQPCDRRCQVGRSDPNLSEDAVGDAAPEHIVGYLFLEVPDPGSGGGSAKPCRKAREVRPSPEYPGQQ